MSDIPCVVSADYQHGHCIHVTFADGVRGSVDFTHWLVGPVFEPLHDPAYFRCFVLEGGTVVWPNGADIAPETLYEAVRPAQSA